MKLNLFSISYAGLWGQDSLPVDDFIGKAAALGYDGVMLAGKRPHLSVLDTDERRIAELRAQLEKYNVSCDVIGAYTDFSMASSELPSTELQISYIEQLARVAQQLDTKIVRVFTAYEKPTEAPLASWRRLTEIFKEACDRVAQFDVTLAIQNHHDIAIATPALLEFLADIDRPNCKLGFDAWSPALRGEDLYESALMAAPHTAITTNADYVRFPQFQYRPELVNYSHNDVDMVRAVPFGDGFIDFKAYFAGLVEGGFDGISTYEMCSPLRGGGSIENLDRCASRFLSWMAEHEFAGT
ncbi:MAG: sugar phosphate isomerase/epimerase family protein [Planctomycetales bacterium]